MDILKLATVNDVCITPSTTNCRDELKLLTVDDKAVTFVRAELISEEIFSSE